MFFNLEINSMLGLAFAGISSLIGFFVVLNHKKMVGRNHFPFILGFLIVIATSGLLYGSISLPEKPDRYWSFGNDIVTYLMILDAVGFIMMLYGIKKQVSRN